MKRASIDFAPPSLALSCARVSPLGWLLGAAALALLVYCGQQLWQLAQQTEAVLLRQQSAQAPLRRAAPVAVVAREPLAAGQVDAVNGAIGQLNLPWRDLFDAIEATTPADVALLSVEPDARKQVVRGVAEAPTSDAMLAYIEGLKRHPFFRQAVLTHHEINDKDPNRPLRFQFDVRWRVQ